MKLRKLNIILLALLLAGMAMVPLVSAKIENSPSNKTLEMKYLQPLVTKDILKLSIPDTKSQITLVTVDPVAFIHDVETNGKIPVKISGSTYSIHLTQEKSPINEDAKLIIESNDGEHVTNIPVIKTYRGNIDSSSKGDALFTVSDDVIIGKISIGNDTFYIDQCGKTTDGRIVHCVYTLVPGTKVENSRPFDIAIKEDINPAAVVHAQDTRGIASRSTGTTESHMSSATTRSTITLLAVYDSQFANAYSNPTAEISNMISQVNSAFSPAGVTININSYYQDSSLVSNQNTYSLLCDFRTSYSGRRDTTNSDLAFFFSGQQLGNDVGGAFSYAGRDATKAYGTAQMVSDGGIFSGSLHQRSVLVAHELGHNFGAEHENAGSSPTWARAYTWTDLWIFTKYTAMWSLWKGDEGQVEFSNVNNHGDSTHNNIQRIADTSSYVVNYQ